MSGSRDHLQVVGGRRLRVRPQPRMQVAIQAIFAGPQEHRVCAMTPQASGRGYGHIAVRVGPDPALPGRPGRPAGVDHRDRQSRRPGRRGLRTGPARGPVPARRRQVVVSPGPLSGGSRAAPRWAAKAVVACAAPLDATVVLSPEEVGGTGHALDCGFTRTGRYRRTQQRGYPCDLNPLVTRATLDPPRRAVAAWASNPSPL